MFVVDWKTIAYSTHLSNYSRRRCFGCFSYCDCSSSLRDCCFCFCCYIGGSDRRIVAVSMAHRRVQGSYIDRVILNNNNGSILLRFSCTHVVNHGFYYPSFLWVVASTLTMPSLLQRRPILPDNLH